MRLPGDAPGTSEGFGCVHEKNSAPARERLKFVHAVVYPPRWELKKDLASRYMELGVLVSASQLYEELELWDDALDCYARMGKKTEALSLVTAKLGGRIAVSSEPGQGTVVQVDFPAQGAGAAARPRTGAIRTP